MLQWNSNRNIIIILCTNYKALYVKIIKSTNRA
jgi:hypothetical protein